MLDDDCTPLASVLRNNKYAAFGKTFKINAQKVLGQCKATAPWLGLGTETTWLGLVNGLELYMYIHCLRKKNNSTYTVGHEPWSSG